jgi:hypothetical protein
MKVFKLVLALIVAIGLIFVTFKANALSMYLISSIAIIPLTYIIIVHINELRN